MALFPRLKTDAVTQYPFSKTFAYSTDVLRFLDGTEQRFRRRGGADVSWTINLSLLDENELKRVRSFYEEHAGQNGTFEFFDPWQEAEHAECSFAADEGVFSLEEIGRGAVTLAIRKRRA